MMLQRFANLCGPSRMVLFCAIILPVIVAENWGPLDNCSYLDIHIGMVVS
jgi:hypothetical protein